MIQDQQERKILITSDSLEKRLKRSSSGLKEESPLSTSSALTPPTIPARTVWTIRATQGSLTFVNMICSGLGIYNIMVAEPEVGGLGVQSSYTGGVLAVTAVGLLIFVIGRNLSNKDQKEILNLMKDIQEHQSELKEEKLDLQKTQTRLLKSLVLLYQHAEILGEQDSSTLDANLRDMLGQYSSNIGGHSVESLFLAQVKQLQRAIKPGPGRELEVEDFQTYFEKETSLTLSSFFTELTPPARPAKHRSLCSTLSYYAGNPLISAMNCVGSSVLLLTALTTLNKVAAGCTTGAGILVGCLIQRGIYHTQKVITDLEHTKEDQLAEIKQLKQRVRTTEQLIGVVRRMNKEIAGHLLDINKEEFKEMDKELKLEIKRLQTENEKLNQKVIKLTAELSDAKPARRKEKNKSEVVKIDIRPVASTPKTPKYRVCQTPLSLLSPPTRRAESPATPGQSESSICLVS